MSGTNIEKKTKHITLTHNDLDEFTVHQTIRDEKEENKIKETLENFGFIFQNDGLITFNENLTQIDEYFNISTLLKIKNEIINNEIAIDLELHSKKINTHTSKISTNFSENKDWFDVEMIIEIESFKFPFSNIIPHLKSGNRLYELPDESIFLIPLEWFSKYKSRN